MKIIEIHVFFSHQLITFELLHDSSNTFTNFLDRILINLVDQTQVAIHQHLILFVNHWQTERQNNRPQQYRQPSEPASNMTQKVQLYPKHNALSQVSAQN